MIIILISFVFITVLIVIGITKNQKKEESLLSAKPTDSNNNINNLLRRANEKIIIKDYKAAVAIADKVLLLQPDNFDALVCRATSLESLNYNLDAIDDFLKALKIDASDANTNGLLGLTYRKIGEIETGQKFLKKAVDKGLKFYEIHYDIFSSASDLMKQAYMKRKNIPENLTRRNPNDFVDNLSQVDRAEFKEAVKNQLPHLEAAISLDPDNKHLQNLYEVAKSQVQ